MKRRRYLTLVTAALLAVAPVATTATTLATHAQVVKADSGEPDSDAIKLTASLKKPTLTLKPYSPWDEDDVAKDITLNHGRVGGVFDITTYKKNKSGHVNWGEPVFEGDLKKGDEGVIVVDYWAVDLKKNTKYSYLSKTDDSGDLVWVTAESMGRVTPTDTTPAIKIPFVVGAKRAITSHNYRVGTIDASSNRVRTYNSRGRFNHHYVYDQHNYKFNQRKVIKGKVYYKLYGKSSYVRANVIDF